MVKVIFSSFKAFLINFSSFLALLFPININQMIGSTNSNVVIPIVGINAANHFPTTNFHP